MIPPPASEYPIDLSTALRLAEAENPTIAAARGPDHRGTGPANGRAGNSLALAQRRNQLPPAYRKPSAVVGADPQPTEQSLYLGGGAVGHRCRAP